MSAKKKATPEVTFIAGGLGGMMGLICTCPLEVVKTRLQAANNKSFLKSDGSKFGLVVFNALKSIYKSDGFFSLWKGIGPNLIGVVPSRAIWFTSYNYSKNYLENIYGEGHSTIHLVSGAISGFTVASLTSPIWVVKTRMQLQTVLQKDSSSNYKSSWDCMKRIYAEEGMRGYYKGLVASYFGIIESTFQLVLYEKFKAVAKEKEIFQKKDGKNDRVMGIAESLTIGSVSKFIASALTYPHEVVRTRMREQRSVEKYKGFFNSLRILWLEEGIAGLYGGMGAHLLRVVPNAAIMFLTFETVVKYLNK